MAPILGFVLGLVLPVTGFLGFLNVQDPTGSGGFGSLWFPNGSNLPQWVLSVTDGCAEWSSGVLTTTGSACGTGGGGGGAFPFTNAPAIGGVSTSTTLGFYNGFVSTASSTITSTLNVTRNLTAGWFQGSINGTASTSQALSANGANCGSGLSPLGVDTAGAVEGCFDVWTEAENTSAAYLSTVDISANTNLTAGDGITLTNDDLDCDTANSSTFGCLSSSDWTLFNGKLSTTSIDTLAELEAVANATNILIENDIDASSELAAIMDDETGSGLLTFNTNATLSSTTLTGLTYTQTASSTRASASTLCIGTDCKTAWPTSGVDTTGTPADNQVAVFTDADTLEGAALLTYDNGNLTHGDRSTTTIQALSHSWSLATSTGSGHSILLVQGGGVNPQQPSKVGINIRNYSAFDGGVDALQIQSQSTDDDGFTMRKATGSGVGNVFMGFQTSRGSLMSPSNVSSGDLLGRIHAYGYGNGFNPAVEVDFETDAAVGSNDMPGRLTINASPDGSATPIEILRLAAASAVFNEASNDIDFRVETNNDANALFIDGGIDDIGVGTSTPTSRFSIVGNGVTSVFSAWTSGIVKVIDILDTGVVNLLGAWDFGGATSLEVPNAAEPTVNATGEIAVDTTSGQISYYNGTSEESLLTEVDRSLIVASSTEDSSRVAYGDASTATTTFIVTNANKATTVTELYCKATKTGTSLMYRIGDGTNWSNAFLCQPAGIEITSIANNTFTAREDIQIQIGTATTSPDSVTITVTMEQTLD